MVDYHACRVTDQEVNGGDWAEGEPGVYGLRRAIHSLIRYDYGLHTVKDHHWRPRNASVLQQPCVDRSKFGPLWVHRSIRQ